MISKKQKRSNSLIKKVSLFFFVFLFFFSFTNSVYAAAQWYAVGDTYYYGELEQDGDDYTFVYRTPPDGGQNIRTHTGVGGATVPNGREEDAESLGNLQAITFTGSGTEPGDPHTRTPALPTSVGPTGASESTSANPTYDDETGVVGCEGIDCDVCHIVRLVERVIDWIINLSFIAGAVIVIIGGLMMVIGGAAEGIQKGKTIITNTIIGLVIIMSAWLIVNIIISVIVPDDALKASGSWVSNWFEVDCDSIRKVLPVTADTSITNNSNISNNSNNNNNSNNSNSNNSNTPNPWLFYDYDECTAQCKAQGTVCRWDPTSKTGYCHSSISGKTCSTDSDCGDPAYICQGSICIPDPTLRSNKALGEECGNDPAFLTGDDECESGACGQPNSSDIRRCVENKGDVTPEESGVNPVQTEPTEYDKEEDCLVGCALGNDCIGSGIWGFRTWYCVSGPHSTESVCDGLCSYDCIREGAIGGRVYCPD